MTSIILRQYLAQLGVDRLTDIHPSLSDNSKLESLFRYARAQYYPAGRDLLGVLHEYHTNHKNRTDAYIRKLEVNFNPVVLDSSEEESSSANILIICFSTDQAHALMRRQYFEIDLAFKRVKGCIREMEIAGFDNELSTTMVYARMYVNSESVESYQNLFSKFFTCLESCTRTKIRWEHLTSEGLSVGASAYPPFGAIIADMDNKQAAGLGKYLAKLDEQFMQRSWQENLQCVLILCHVHFKRGIQTLGHHPACGRLLQLPDVSSFAEAKALLNDIREEYTSDRDVVAWCRHKMTDWILAGLCPNLSSVNSNLRSKIRTNTNVGESSHNTANLTGKNLMLLAALMNGMSIDLNKFSRKRQVEQFGSQLSQRNASAVARQSRTFQRTMKTKQSFYQSVDVTNHQLLRRQSSLPPAQGLLERNDLENMIDADCFDPDELYQEEFASQPALLSLSRVEMTPTPTPTPCRQYELALERLPLMSSSGAMRAESKTPASRRRQESRRRDIPTRLDSNAYRPNAEEQKIEYELRVRREKLDLVRSEQALRAKEIELRQQEQALGISSSTFL